MAITADQYLEIVNALIEKGMPEAEAHATVAAELTKQSAPAADTPPPMRDQYGRLNTKAHAEFFSHANKQELAKKYFDPLDGIESIDTLTKKEQMDIITGRSKEAHKPNPLRNVQDGIDFFKSLREGK
ncbi:hypothetical protein [Enterobacter roggenkampii]|uniref:hypothetical protein n=1 Tax=Enterobacter roggenkampii TaxID=1812935 RepID=UPI002FF94C52